MQIFILQIYLQPQVMWIFVQLVLTGGPCGGKTTGQARLATFFENLGWKVFRVPETATILMSGGISFGELNNEQVPEQAWALPRYRKMQFTVYTHERYQILDTG